MLFLDFFFLVVALGSSSKHSLSDAVIQTFVAVLPFLVIGFPACSSFPPFVLSTPEMTASTSLDTYPSMRSHLMLCPLSTVAISLTTEFTKKWG